MKNFLFLILTFLSSTPLLAMEPTGPGGGFMRRCFGWCPWGGRFGMMRILVVVLLIIVIILAIALLRKKK